MNQENIKNNLVQNNSSNSLGIKNISANGSSNNIIVNRSSNYNNNKIVLKKDEIYYLDVLS